jgi:hypothetical protein
MAPFGYPLPCCSLEVPHIDICHLPVVSSEAVSALHTAALDIRQVAISALASFIGPENLPYPVNLHDNPYDGWQEHYTPQEIEAMSMETQLQHSRAEYLAAFGTFNWEETIDEEIGPLCAPTARLLWRILGPRDQADVPTIREILQTPVLAPFTALARARFAEKRSAFQVQHHAAYLAGVELEELLVRVFSAHTSTSSTSTSSSSSSSSSSTGAGTSRESTGGYFTQRVTALQRMYAAPAAPAALAHEVTPPAADSCEVALAGTAALQGRCECAWGRAHLAAAEW